MKRTRAKRWSGEVLALLRVKYWPNNDEYEIAIMVGNRLMRVDHVSSAFGTSFPVMRRYLDRLRNLPRGR